MINIYDQIERGMVNRMVHLVKGGIFMEKVKKDSPVLEPKVNKIEFFNNNKDSHYYPTVGITNCKINMYNELIHNYAKICFTILDNSQLSYALFSGQSIGYLRNKENIPWIDDYDIIIFSEDVKKFMKEVVPTFEKHNFNICPTAGHMKLVDPSF